MKYVSLQEYPNPIAHFDGDSFFVSVERALDPRLKGKPVATGGERGIVSSASDEAKARGVRRPMAMAEAKRLCPELICVASDYEAYSLFSVRFLSILRRFTPVVEEFSIDEAFTELSGLRRLYRKDFPEIAREMKETVERELGIPISVGLASSKTLAKIASARAKPSGVLAVPANELQSFLPKVRVSETCGIGPNSTALLAKHGVVTAWDYVSRPMAWAEEVLGKIGVELWRELRGECVYPMSTEPKHDYASISKAKTFTPSREEAFLRAQITRNAESAFIKLRRHGLRAGGMLAFLRDDSFRAKAAEVEFERVTSSAMEAVRFASYIFDRVWETGKRYRQTGVVLFKLTGSRETQTTLFDDPVKIRSLKALDEAIDEASRRFGKHSVHAATAAPLGPKGCGKASVKQVPARREDNLDGEDARRRLSIPLWQLKLT